MSTGNAEIEELIMRARVRMLLNMPFFGNLATRLIVKDGSGWVSTAATDGRHLYYNVDFFKKLEKKELEFVIAHEVMHCVYDHMHRRGSREARLWNCAGDFIINWELHQQKVGQFPACIKVLFDSKYDNMAAEEIYDQLKQEDDAGKGDKSMDSFDTHMDPDAKGPQKGAEDCEECDGSGSVPGDKGDGGDEDGGKGGSGDEAGEGEGGSEGHGHGEGGTKECPSCGGSGKKPGLSGDPSGKNGPIPMSEEEREMMREEIKTAVQQAAKTTDAGNVPAGVRRMIKELTEPQMDWREILNCEIQSSMKSDFSFSRPNRKMWGTGIILPGMLPDEDLKVDICIDTSGSVSEQMLRDFLSEVMGIVGQYASFEISVWTFDTKVYNRQKFGPQNINDLPDYDIQGGGGTDFEVNWDFMKYEEITPHRFIMMTDGYPCGSWGDELYCDTVFLIHGNDQIVAPFGTTVYYKEDEHTKRI